MSVHFSTVSYFCKILYVLGFFHEPKPQLNNMLFHIFSENFLLEIKDVWVNFFLHELTYYVLPLFVSTRIFHCKLYKFFLFMSFVMCSSMLCFDENFLLNKTSMGTLFLFMNPHNMKYSTFFLTRMIHCKLKHFSKLFLFMNLSHMLFNALV